MSSHNLVVLLVLLPLFGVVFALISNRTNRPRVKTVLEWLAAGIGLFCPLIILWALLPVVREGSIAYTVGNQPQVLGIAQRFDGLSWLVDLMGFSSLAVVWIYTRGAGPRGGLFTTLFLIQTSAMAAMGSCADLFNLFVCFEVLGIANYALVALAEKPRAFFAAFNYLAISSASLTFFLLGVFGLYRLTGSLSYQGIVRGLAALPDGGTFQAQLSLACIVAASLVRVALMPLAGWLPDAHGSAPHAVTAVGCGMLLKPPLFALGRFLTELSSGGGRVSALVAPLWNVLGILGVLTALGGVICALSQSDVKRLLAYHSISQVGYIVCAWALASPLGMAAAFLHAFSHAIFKGLLFLSAGTAADAGNNRDVYAYRGARKFLAQAGDRQGITTICFCIAALSIAALPPFSGFAGKHGILHSLEHGRWQYTVLSLVGIGTMASMIKLGRIFFGTPSPAGTDAAAYRINGPIKLSMVLWAIPCVLFGIFAIPLGRFVGALTGAEHNPVPEDLFSASSLGKTGLYLLGAIVLYRLLMGRWGKDLSHRILDLPKGFYGLMAGFVLALCIFCAAFLAK
ncbi:putative cation antiporter NADH dehydrogenase subunit [Spirochaetia bacterium]|nr:putative cation antiporter NADH dehydrogenase subunit [Spirochaetia bacterium]